MESLIGLEELWLAQNKITELKVCMSSEGDHPSGPAIAQTLQNLAPLPNLRILSIQSNRLTEIKGLESLQTLEELHIADNLLTELSGLDQNKALRVMDISRNRIRRLSNIKHLSHIEEFWASSNLLDSFDEIETELADMKDLNTVYFEGNPLQTNNAVTYRNKIRLRLPQIQQIDASKLYIANALSEQPLLNPLIITLILAYVQVS